MMMPPDRTPKGQRSITPTLFYALLIAIALAIAAFLVLRPGGKGSTTSSPASPAQTQH